VRSRSGGFQEGLEAEAEVGAVLLPMQEDKLVDERHAPAARGHWGEDVPSGRRHYARTALRWKYVGCLVSPPPSSLGHRSL
jgi:hypothetical protein